MESTWIAAVIEHEAPREDRRARVPLVDRAAMRLGMRLLLRAHERAAHLPTFDAEQQRNAREEDAARRRGLLLPVR